MKLYRFQLLADFGRVAHAITTRLGGVSSGRYDSLNIALHVGDDPNLVIENRKRVVALLGCAPGDLVLAQQAHTANVAVVTKNHRGLGAFNHESALPAVDALVTQDSGVCLAVMVADCSPILLYDPKNDVIAAIHAGRAGIQSKIVSHAVQTMHLKYGTRAENLIAGVGPSIRGTHYTISPDQALSVSKALGPETDSLRPNGDRFHFDLPIAHREQLLSLGLEPKKIELFEESTFSKSSEFFSERRDGPPTGRFGLFVMLT